MRDHDTLSSIRLWSMAIRPRTLPAAVAPVVVGSAIAAADGRFVLLPALAAMIGALLLQIGVNLANDYFDYVNGIDSERRLGPPRVTQSGLIPPDRVRSAMILTLVASALVGLYLIRVGGWPIAAIGLASILAALAYSGGPFPLASNGLGDLFVFIFFGLVAVCGTYYVQALELTRSAVMAALPVGFLITAILVVNNLRDIPTDRQAGKRTLAVILGRRGARIEYLILVVGSYVVLPLIWAAGWGSAWLLLPMFSLPLAVSQIRTVQTGTEGPVLNRALAGTANLALVFSLLFSIGLILSNV